MKKIFSAVLSLVLCGIMLLSFCSPAYAATEKTAFIVVSGMNTFPLSDENGDSVFPMQSDTIWTMVKNILPYASAYLIDKDADKLCDGIIPALYDAFGKIACDEQGNSVYKLTTPVFNGSVKNYTEYFEGETSDEQGVVNAAIEKYGAENTFFFNYDWRLSPLDHADELNTFIKAVKASTNADRIELAAFSMGGTVTLSYLYKYGSADIDSIALCSTAFQGTSSVGDLFTGKVGMSMEGLLRRLAQLTRNNFEENLIEYINEWLTLSGFNGGISEFANDVVNETSDRVYAEFITPVFGQLPGFLAIADIDSYEEARDFMLSKTKNAGLIKKTDEYYYNVQLKAEELLKNARKDTCIYIFAQYNMQGLPVSENSNTSNNDYLIDAKYASGGATCSKLGETLGENYVQAEYNDKNYISPDNQIDASTCMFPEITWFIRDMGHVDYPVGDSTDFIFTLLDSKTQLTVNDLEEYPQFLKYSYEDNSLTPVKADGEKTFADKFFGFLKEVLRKFYAVLDKINIFA